MPRRTPRPLRLVETFVVDRERCTRALLRLLHWGEPTADGTGARPKTARTAPALRQKETSHAPER